MRCAFPRMIRRPYCGSPSHSWQSMRITARCVACTRQSRFSPSHPTCNSRHARLHARKAGLRHARAALAQQPANVEALVRTGLALAATSAVGEANAVAAQLEAMNPKSPDLLVLVRLAELAIAAGNPDKDCELRQQAHERAPSGLRARFGPAKLTLSMRLCLPRSPTAMPSRSEGAAHCHVSLLLA